LAFAIFSMVAACQANADVKPVANAPLNAQQKEFVSAFQALKAKHGAAADGFQLADFSDDAALARSISGPSTIWECHLDDDHLAQCTHEHPQ
jgi:hypothetical protein